MSKNRTRSRTSTRSSKGKAARKHRLSPELRRILVTGVIILAGALAVTGGTLGILRAVRLSRIYIQLPQGVSLPNTHAEPKSQTDAAPDGANQTGIQPPDSPDPVQNLTETLLTLVPEIRDSYRTTAPGREDTDIILQQHTPRTPREALAAFDPYLLYTDSRHLGSPYPIPQNATLQSFMETLAGRFPPSDSAGETAPVQPLVVAGNVDQDLLTLVLYISQALLSQGDFNALLSDLSRRRDTKPAGTFPDSTSQETASSAADSPVILPELLQPALSYLRELMSRGLLAYNWTNWDRLALGAALDQGTGAVFFLPRSLMKEIPPENRFSLTPQLPPPGQGKLTFSLFGRGLSILPGPGPRSQEAATLLTAARDPAFQEQLERTTPWSPVLRGASVLNRSHRDVVSWISRASALYVPEARNLSPLIAEIRRQLR